MKAEPEMHNSYDQNGISIKGRELVASKFGIVVLKIVLVTKTSSTSTTGLVSINSRIYRPERVVCVVSIVLFD